MAYAVLIIEDETTLAKNIQLYLARADYEVRIANTAEEGLRQVESFKPDAVLLDLRLPDMSGLEAFGRIRAIDSQAKVIIVTAHGNVETAVEAMKNGAYDFLSKPLVLGKLKLLLDKAVGQTRLEGALSYYLDKDAGDGHLAALIGDSPPMQALKDQLRRLIEAERMLRGTEPPPAVLITGETGTGKELVARALHYQGLRKDHPFVEINCASIPDHLQEAELFGYERGAFTDAKERKIGLFEAADGGTLLLDEIGDTTVALQAKLLKSIEDKVIRRLGSVRDQRVNVRIIAATNQVLEELIRLGRFRSDLYFRLRIVHLQLPPLRARGGDILLLAKQFLETHGRRYGKKGLRFTPEAEAALLQHSWPGNVRELRNAVEQAVLLSRRELIEPHQLPLNLEPVPPPVEGARPEPRRTRMTLPPGGISLEEVERDLVLQALEQTSGNVTQAARLLGMSRDTLRYRMEKYKSGPGEDRATD